MAKKDLRMTPEERAQREETHRRVQERIREREELERRWKESQESGSTESPTRTTPGSSTSA
jgi:hypothetical protein